MHAHYDCIIKEGGASYRTSVHSHYRETVKSKYVDIAISFAQPSQDSQLDQFKYNYHDMISIIAN